MKKTLLIFACFLAALNVQSQTAPAAIRAQIYDIAAEAAISGEQEIEGLMWFVIEQMKEPNFAGFYAVTFPQMLDVLSVPEKMTREEIEVSEKIISLKKRLFPEPTN